MESLNEMWGLVCEQLKASLNEVIFNIWFTPIEILSFDGEKVELAVSEFKKTTIQKQFGKEFAEAFKNVLGFDPEIVMIDPEKQVIKQEPKKRTDNSAAESDRNTFSTFVVGPSNRFAYNAAKAVAVDPAVAYNPLFIHGSSGLGKTHLLCAIKNEILKNNPDSKVIMTRGEDFANLIIEGIRQKNMNSVHEHFRSCDVLLVDDIQFIAGKPSTQEEFFHTFNALTAAGKQIVLISDSTPKDIAVLDERLRTRFEQGLIADIQPPDFETRLAIVRSKAESLGLEIPTDVAEFIATKVKTNIRQIEGAVNTIHALVNLGEERISIRMAQNAIKDFAGEGLPTNELVNKLIAETARTFGVRVDDVVSKKKDSKIAKARQTAIYVIRECTGLTQQQISEYFGDMDRTTVHYSYNKIEDAAEKDPSVRKLIDSIIKNSKEH